jgi:hypothetical protein
VSGLVQNPIHDLSLGVLRNCGACLSDAPGQGIHLNDKSRDDDADAFPVLSSVSVEREAGTPAAKQFDAGNSVDVNILNRNGLDGSWRENKTFLHCWPPLVTRELSQKNSHKQYAAQHLSHFQKIARILPQNAKSKTSASFPYSIRATGSSPTVRDSAGRLSAAPVRRAPYNQPFAMSGQLAGNNKSVARSLIRSACSDRACLNENPSRHNSYLLPGIVCRVRVFTSSHAGQQSMETFRDVGQVFRGESRV